MFLAQEVLTAVPGEIEVKSTQWLSSLGACLTLPDSLVADDLWSTCREPGAWFADGCSLESGAFVIAPTTRLAPTRWTGQIKHAIKCYFFRNVPMPTIKQDHGLRA